MSRLLIATSNPGKLRDLLACLADLPWDLLSPADLGLSLAVEERGISYVENAALKARAYFAAAGIPTVGEDSGLEVDALGGGPGVLSARYLGLPDGAVKNARLLERLAGVPASRRGCRYRCAVVLVLREDQERVFEGMCAGRIALTAAGEGGFGFDPIVEVPRLGRTLAELSDEERLRFNHRGRAARKLARYLTGARL